MTPKLIEYYRDGRFPFDKMIEYYPFEEINTAFDGPRKGNGIKAVLTME